MIATTAQITDYKAAKTTRLVSFENSNSWLKRFDDEGVLVVQAGYKLNPNAVEQRNRDQQNPIVVVADSRRECMASRLVPETTHR